MRIAIHVGKRHSLKDQRLLRTAKALKFGIGNAYVEVNPSILETFDFIHAHDLDALPKALLHKMMTSRQTKVIYDAHEDWSVYRKPYVKWAEAMMLPFVDGAISPSLAITQRLAKTVKVTQTIMNCPELPEASNKPKYEKFTVAYAGHICPGRGYGHLLEAAKILHRQGIDIRYLLMGEGTIDIPSDLQLQFEVTGQLPHDEMMKRLQRCHLGLVLFEDNPNHRICLPHKLFEYMAAGIPTVAPFDCRAISQIIHDEDCGYAGLSRVDGVSIAAVLQLVLRFPEKYEKRAANALAASKNGYNAPVQAAKLTHLYGRLS